MDQELRRLIKHLLFDRPLAVLDLETTRTDPQQDRIVEISILKLALGTEPDHRTRRANPGVPIPSATTEIQGIRDEDVAANQHFTT